MKKIVITTLVLAGMAIGAKAQKGTLLVYGNAGLSTTKNAADQKTTTLGIHPGVGYQFSDHWTAGVYFDYDHYKNADASKSNSYGVGPFVRYAEPLGGIFSVYGQLQAGYAHSKNEVNVGGVTSKTTANGFETKFFPAIFINVKNNFGLNFDFGGIAFNTSKVKGASSSSNSFDVNFGKTINIGISKNF